MIGNSEIILKKVQPSETITDTAQEKAAVKPKIDFTACQKNYNCVVYCPKNAISVNSKGSPAINYDLCDGCLICLRECPIACIREDKE